MKKVKLQLKLVYYRTKHDRHEKAHCFVYSSKPSRVAELVGRMWRKEDFMHIRNEKNIYGCLMKRHYHICMKKIDYSRYYE